MTGIPGALGEGGDFRSRRLTAAADHHQGPFGGADGLGGTPDLPGVPDRGRSVTGQVDLGLEGAVELGLLNVLGHVDEHRSRTPRRGDVERLADHPGNVVDVLDEVVVLGDGQGDAVDVGLLKGVRCR
jgi:hypothetical protein